MTRPSAATLAAHQEALAHLTNASTTSELAAALSGWQQLDQPGFANDLPDGDYFDGFHYGSMRGGDLAVTQLHHLPTATKALLEQLRIERRDAAERDEVIAAIAALDVEGRGPGRPAIGKPMLVRLPDWRRARITADAQSLGAKDAELIRWLIGEAYRQLTEDADAQGISREELLQARYRETGR